jgi:ribonuclease BN (tRNA processing enzyme)
VVEKAALDGELLAEPGFRIRGLALDHQGTPVIAYAFEADQQINIRKDRLKVRGLAPGPWLSELKKQLSCNNPTAVIQLPDGSHEDASTLADELVVITPGKKLVYATDLADTADNRQQLIRLAQHAHTFFCECAYIEADARYALMNGHLTTRACGEIATQASVTRLVPFHFSRRYLNKTDQLYEELTQHCSRVCLPRTMTLFESGVKQESVMEIDQER